MSPSGAEAPLASPPPWRPVPAPHSATSSVRYSPLACPAAERQGLTSEQFILSRYYWAKPYGADENDHTLRVGPLTLRPPSAAGECREESCPSRSQAPRSVLVPTIETDEDGCALHRSV